MGVIKTIIILILLFCFGVFTTLEVSAANDFGDLETNISPESSSDKIEKLQSFFTQLGLYKGSINGKYTSIEPSLKEYQMEKGLISHYDDWGAGHFGEKTLVVLQEEFGSRFEENKYILNEDKPVVGERYFYVTAYYSPLRGQKRYTTGSYSGDIRLNGNGKHAASGKEVFTGLLAAPRNYDFGTKIYLEGIGIGSVEDRGGAIVNAGERGFEHDRIDIWMGYGDEGLARALKWGKRKVKGQVVESYNSPTIAFDESPVAKFRDFRVNEDSESVEIKKLQELFSQLKIYNGDLDGNYNSIKEDIISYQVEKKIILSRYSEQAGYFGPKTFDALIQEHGGGIFQPDASGYSSEVVVLTRKQALEIFTLKKKIDQYIEKKSDGNSLKSYKYKKQFRSQLEKMLIKSKNKTTKAKLSYLKDNI